MFEMISIVVVTLRQQRRIQTLASTKRFLPSLAVSNAASPHGWSQNWSHLLATAANYSRITTSNALRGLPWAQGVAGSNPVAPTIHALSFASGRRDVFRRRAAPAALGANPVAPIIRSEYLRRPRGDRPEYHIPTVRICECRSRDFAVGSRLVGRHHHTYGPSYHFG